MTGGAGARVTAGGATRGATEPPPYARVRSSSRNRAWNCSAGASCGACTAAATESGAAAAAALPASLKLDDRLGVSVAACGTRRYSTVSTDAFAGNTTQPSVAAGFTAVYSLGWSTVGAALDGQKARGGAVGPPLHATNKTKGHRPTDSCRNSADPQHVETRQQRREKLRAVPVAEQQRIPGVSGSLQHQLVRGARARPHRAGQTDAWPRTGHRNQRKARRQR